MTKFYKRLEVTGVANKEKLGDILTSTAEEPKHVTALWFTETTAAENNDAILRAYVEREKVLDMSIKHMLSTMDADGRYWKPRIEVDIILPVGQSLSVGHLSGGTLSVIDIVAEYEKTA